MSFIIILGAISIFIIMILLLSPLWSPIFKSHRRVNTTPIVVSPSYRLGPGGEHLPDINPHKLGPGGQRWPHPPHLLGPGGQQQI